MQSVFAKWFTDLLRISLMLLLVFLFDTGDCKPGIALEIQNQVNENCNIDIIVNASGTKIIAGDSGRNSIPQTCCPEGPPYVPQCSEGFYYYFHDNQLQAAPAPATMLTQSPWRHTGLISIGNGIGTGVLVHPNYVLTAAHVVTRHSGTNNPAQFDDNNLVFFKLAQPCTECLPYGSTSAKRIWVPQEWMANVGGSYDSRQTRAYDWALLEIDLSPTLFTEGVPNPIPMGITNQTYQAFEQLTPHAAGYPCGRDASGSFRRNARPYATDNSASFLGQEMFSGGGSLYLTSLEATAGMSGGPVWVEQNGEDVLVGVVIGSTQEACNSGENWVVGLSANMRERILNIITERHASNMVSHRLNAGGGGFLRCNDLFGSSIANGPCPLGFGNEQEGECGNPERLNTFSK